ncbi:hypothetical protein PG990_009506 [Apiospora arundinis]
MSATDQFTAYAKRPGFTAGTGAKMTINIFPSPQYSLPERSARLAFQIAENAGHQHIGWFNKDHGVVQVLQNPKAVILMYDDGNPLSTSYHVITGFDDLWSHFGKDLTPQELTKMKKSVKTKRFGRPKPLANAILRAAVDLNLTSEGKREYILATYQDARHNQNIQEETRSYLSNPPTIEDIREKASVYINRRTKFDMILTPEMEGVDLRRLKVARRVDEGTSEFTWVAKSITSEDKAPPEAKDTRFQSNSSASSLSLRQGTLGQQDQEPSDEQQSVAPQSDALPQEQTSGGQQSEAPQGDTPPEEQDEELDAWGNPVVKTDIWGNVIGQAAPAGDEDEKFTAGKVYPQDVMNEAHRKVRAAYFQATRTDKDGNRYASYVSMAFPAITFANPKGNVKGKSRIPEQLPYTNRYVTSIGNARGTTGYHSTVRFFDARFGYGKLNIAHSYVTSEQNEYQFATTELSVLYSTVDENVYEYGMMQPDGRLSPLVRKSLEKMGLVLPDKDWDNVDLHLLPAYKMSVTVDGEGIRHRIDPGVIAKIRALDLKDHESIISAVQNTFGKRDDTKFTFFFPGLNDQCARTLKDFKVSRIRAEDEPYSGMFNKVPTTMAFTNINQLAEVKELNVKAQEHPTVRFENIVEFTARHSYAVRDEHLLSDSIAALLVQRPQQAFYIPLSYLQIQGRDVAGLVGIPKPTLHDAQPRMDEVCYMQPDLPFKVETPTEVSEFDANAKTNWLKRQLVKAWHEAKDVGQTTVEKQAYFREKLNDIVIPAQQATEMPRRVETLDQWSLDMMPQFKDKKHETPADHKARLEEFAAAEVNLFKWPKDSLTEAPPVDIAWPRVELESSQHASNQQIQRAIKSRMFSVKIIREAHDDTVKAQLHGIATATKEHREESPYGNCVDFCLRFDDTKDQRDMADFFPAIKHLRDRIAGNKFEECAFASASDRDPSASGHPENDDEPMPRKLDDYGPAQDAPEVQKENEALAEARTAPPSITKAASDRMYRAYLSLSGEQQEIYKADKLPCGIMLVNGGPGSGKSIGLIKFLMAIQSTTVDIHEVNKSIETLQPEGLRRAMKLAHDTSEEKMATRFAPSLADMKQPEYVDAEGYDRRGKKLAPGKSTKKEPEPTPDEDEAKNDETSPAPATEWNPLSTEDPKSSTKDKGPRYRESCLIFSGSHNDQLDALAPKAYRSYYETNGKSGMIVRVTNPNATKGDLESIVNGKTEVFDIMPEPDLDETTAEFMLYHVAQDAKKKSERGIRGGNFNVASHMNNFVTRAGEGDQSSSDAVVVHNLLAKRKLALDKTRKDQINWSKDDADSLKKHVKALELHVINSAAVILGTPVALSKLSRRQGLDIFVSAIFIDEAYRMTEADTWTVLSAFKDALLRAMAGDGQQLGPLVLSQRSDHDEESETYFTGIFSRQMAMPLAMRMERGGVRPITLRINHRACGGVSDFCSENFYHGAMVESTSDRCKEEIQRCADIIGGMIRSNVRGSMFNFDLTGSAEVQTGSSYVNPMHARYIAEIVFRLHFQNAPAYIDPDDDKEGKRATILIAAFYSEQAQLILSEINRLPNSVCWKDGITVTTVDGAQGDEADIVIVDHVRSSKLGFTGEHQRVNVAYSRARFLNISVLNSKAISIKDYKIGDSGKDIIIRQRKYANARSAQCEIKPEDTQFCEKCWGRAHKGKCNNEVMCTICDSTSHHTRNCRMRNKPQLTGTIPPSSAPTVPPPGSTQSGKNTTAKQVRCTPREQMGRKDKVAVRQTGLDPDADITMHDKMMASVKRLEELREKAKQEKREKRRQAKAQGIELADEPEEFEEKLAPFTDASRYHELRRVSKVPNALTSGQITPDRMLKMVYDLGNLENGDVLELFDNWAVTRSGRTMCFYTAVHPIGKVEWDMDTVTLPSECRMSGPRNATVEALILCCANKIKTEDQVAFTEEACRVAREDYVRENLFNVNQHNGMIVRQLGIDLTEIECNENTIGSLLEAAALHGEKDNRTYVFAFNGGWTICGNPVKSKRAFRHKDLGEVVYNTKAMKISGSAPCTLQAFLQAIARVFGEESAGKFYGLTEDKIRERYMADFLKSYEEELVKLQAAREAEIQEEFKEELKQDDEQIKEAEGVETYDPLTYGDGAGYAQYPGQSAEDDGDFSSTRMTSTQDDGDFSSTRMTSTQDDGGSSFPWMTSTQDDGGSSFAWMTSTQDDGGSSFAWMTSDQDDGCFSSQTTAQGQGSTPDEPSW